jgi:hypothetical protein
MKPTISGEIVHDLAQVLITVEVPGLRSLIFLNTLSSTYGPFLRLLAMSFSLLAFSFLVCWAWAFFNFPAVANLVII